MRRLTLPALLLAMLLVHVSAARASTVVSFADTAIHWPGFSDPLNHHGQNTKDVIGTPQITGGDFIFDGHSLVGIELDYASTDRALVPADWFFDFDQDGDWDYVLHNSNRSSRYANVYKLYDVSSKNLSIQDSSIYKYSTWPRGYAGRYSHPVAIKSWHLPDPADNSVDFTGWTLRKDQTPATALWSGFSIDLTPYSGKDFTYAFAMLCANDVVYGDGNVPAPEPGSLMLMGAGALGLAFLRRRAAIARRAG